MNRIYRALVTLSLLPVLLTGCAATATTACDAKTGANVTVCVNGKAVDFSAEKNQPHKHESGNLYAPVVPLANALGVKIETDVNGKTVTVNGKKVDLVPTETIKGVHVHDGALFVPLKEFAAAAGLKMDMNFDRGTAGFAK